MYQRLRDYCDDKGISIRRLETECGFSHGYIAKLDSICPSVLVIKRLSEVTGIPIEELTNLATEK